MKSYALFALVAFAIAGLTSTVQASLIVNTALSTPIQNAERLLKEAKAQSHFWNVEPQIGAVRRIMDEGGYAAEEIGTSETELHKVRRDGFVATASYNLDVARKAADRRDVFVELRNIMFCVSRTDEMLLEDVGSGFEEISGLEIRGYEAEAIRHLTRAVELGREDRNIEMDRELNIAAAYAKKAGMDRDKLLNAVFPPKPE